MLRFKSKGWKAGELKKNPGWSSSPKPTCWQSFFLLEASQSFALIGRGLTHYGEQTALFKVDQFKC